MTRVLVVEDEESYSEALAYMLRKEGFEVAIAADGHAALVEFDRNGADIVLLDVMLPGMSGTEVCKQLRVRGAVPVIMLTAPIPATQKVLARSGLSIDDIGVYEVNEAFAPVPMAWLADLGADAARLNPRGGAIALGHPLGGSGARIMTTLIHQMRDGGIRYGLQTMCEGGGMANATILELVRT